MKKFTFAERVWLQAAFLLLAAAPMTLIAYQLDGRLINDIPIWIKPLKFYVSTALHLATLAVLVRFLPDKTRRAAWLSVLAGVSATAAIFEIMLIAGQAARGVASHFNRDTMLDLAIYGIMGLGAVFIVAPAIVLGVKFLRTPVSEKLTPGLKLGAGLGLTLGFILTLTIAGYMSAQPTGHWVGAPPTDAGGLPVFGWSRQGGDLRVPHFFATHLMQALPFAGFLADRSVGAAAAKRTVWAVAAVGVAVALATFVQALSGMPFIS